MSRPQGLLVLAAVAILACRRNAAPAPIADASLPPEASVTIDSAPPTTDATDTPPRATVPITHWPHDATDSRRAIVLLHGGGGPRYFTELADYRRYPEALAAAGYHVFMPHLVGCGHCTTEAYDAIAAIANTPGMRADRIGVIGFSAGAFRAFSLVAGAPKDMPRVAAVVALYGGLNDPKPEATSFPPTLVLHGERDEMVPPSHAREVERWLKGMGTPATVHLYPDQKHGFTGAALTDSVTRAVNFMREHVKDDGGG